MHINAWLHISQNKNITPATWPNLAAMPTHGVKNIQSLWVGSEKITERFWTNVVDERTWTKYFTENSSAGIASCNEKSFSSSRWGMRDDFMQLMKFQDWTKITFGLWGLHDPILILPCVGWSAYIPIGPQGKYPVCQMASPAQYISVSVWFACAWHRQELI